MKKIYLSAFAVMLTTLMMAQSFSPTTSVIPAYNSGGCTGVTDMNNDGLDDIIILDQSTDLKIAYQQPDGTFDVSSFGSVSGGEQWGMCIGDVDNDGHKDVMCGGHYDGIHIVNINGPGDYEQIDYQGDGWDDIYMQGSNLADIDNDGWLDGFGCHDDGHSAILHNNGNGLFSNGASLMDLTFYPEINGNDNAGNYGSVWTDFDRDGDIDLFIAKCRQFISDPLDPRRTNVLMVNDGSNNYTEQAVERGLVNLQQSWTSDFADMDNDGDFDVLLTTHSNTLEIYENDGTGYFTDVTEGSGLQYSGFFLQAKMADFDNDGYLDVIHSGGDHRYFHNNGDMTWTLQPGVFPNVDVMHSFAIGDLNHDGWLDLYASYGDGYVNPDNSHDDAIFFNNGGDNNFVVFDLEGVISNKDAAGALVEIHGAWGVQIREVRDGESYGITNASACYFGLGDATEIEYAVIHWPAGGEVTINNPDINTWYNVIEGECVLGAPVVSAGGATTICEGGSVMLSVAGSSVDYEWNNGATTSSIEASDAGNYFVTVSDDNGCEAISAAINVSYYIAEPASINATGDLEFCEGSSIQLIASEGTGFEWSSGQDTQAIEVTESGDYTVVVTGLCESTTSESTVSVQVHATPGEPTITDMSFMPPAAVTFTVSGGTDVRWYTSEAATTPVYEGSSYTTPSLSSTTSYWVEDVLSYGGIEGSGGRTEADSDSDGAYLTSTSYYLKFDAYTDIVIHTVKVDAQGSGNRTVKLVDNGGATLTQATINIPDGVSEITLDFFVPQGTGYGLRCDNETPNLWRDKDLSVGSPWDYPYDLDGLGSITGTNVGGEDADNYYYFFYDWNVHTPVFECTSERVEVQAIALGMDELTGVRQINLYPNPASSVLNVNFASTIGTKMQVRLIDQTGRTVQSTQWNTSVGNNSLTLDLDNVASGVYQLQFAIDGKTATRKFVVE